MRILLAEDDKLLGEAIQDGLQFKGHRVDWFMDGQTTYLATTTENYECIILDIGLPRRSGLDVLDSLRKDGNESPVLILTAMDAISDRVAGLDKGADDYLTKPFDMDELSARIRALFRRSKGRSQPTITHQDIVVYPHACQVEKSGRKIDLSRREYALFVTLIENAGRLFSQHELEEALYNWDGDIESNTIQVHIHNIRKKIDKNIIRTVRGMGYVVDKVQ
jgi:two-component system response regulator QseB